MKFRTISKAAFALAVIATLAVTGSDATHADITIIGGSSIRPAGASPVGSGTIYKLEVTPAKEASPAFKYRFTVPPHKTIPGNAITHYLRALGEKGLSAPWDFAVKETDYKVQDWGSSKISADQIPLEKLREITAVFDGLVTNHLERATLCRDADWGIAVEDLNGIEGTVGFMLPSVQEMRSMSRAVLLRNRLAIIEKRYDDVIDGLRIVYRHGHNTNEMGFLVTNLVGVAQTGMANDGAKLLIASDDSPNLYWALAEVEVPNARRSLRLDASMPLRVFPELMDASNADYAKDEWKRLLEKYTADIGEISSLVSNNSSSAQSSSLALGFGLAGYGNAKKRMAERGYAKQQIDKMGVAEVLLRDAAYDIEYFSQGMETVFYLPRKEAIKRTNAWEKKLSSVSPTRVGALLAGMLVPASLNVIDAGLKVEAEVNVLMAIESLRNHAAINGSFPESLDQLELPVRENPLTQKPFNYTLEGNKAVLTYELSRSRIERYEITIKE